MYSKTMVRAALVGLVAAGSVVDSIGAGPAHAAVGGYQMSFQANTTQLWSIGDAGNVNTELGMMPGTSPAIAALPGGGYQMAFQANTTELWSVGDAGNVNTGLGMMPGTSPAIAASPHGGYQIVFQANTGSLWTFSPDTGGVDYRLGMASGTSPAIAALPGGGYQMAFQANTTQLWSIGGAGNVNTELGMMPGTSPAIAASPHGGYQIAFQANTSDLWSYSPAGGVNYRLGMSTGTSPTITALDTGGVAEYSPPLPRDAVPRGEYDDPHHDYPAIDIGVPEGTPALAVVSGTVVRFSSSACGIGMELTSSALGAQFVYCHLSGYSVPSGASVSAGQQIALTGNTGNSTAPHLHFELEVNNGNRCPQSWLVAIYDGGIPPRPSTLPTMAASHSGSAAGRWLKANRPAYRHRCGRMLASSIGSERCSSLSQ